MDRKIKSSLSIALSAVALTAVAEDLERRFG